MAGRGAEDGDGRGRRGKGQEKGEASRARRWEHGGRGDPTRDRSRHPARRRCAPMPPSSDPAPRQPGKARAATPARATALAHSDYGEAPTRRPSAASRPPFSRRTLAASAPEATRRQRLGPRRASPAAARLATVAPPRIPRPPKPSQIQARPSAEGPRKSPSARTRPSPPVSGRAIATGRTQTTLRRTLHSSPRARS